MLMSQQKLAIEANNLLITLLGDRLALYLGGTMNYRCAFPLLGRDFRNAENINQASEMLQPRVYPIRGLGCFGNAEKDLVFPVGAGLYRCFRQWLYFSISLNDGIPPCRLRCRCRAGGNKTQGES